MIKDKIQKFATEIKNGFGLDSMYLSIQNRISEEGYRIEAWGSHQDYLDAKQFHRDNPHVKMIPLGRMYITKEDYTALMEEYA